MIKEIKRIASILGIRTPKIQVVNDMEGTQMAAANVEENIIYLREGLGKYDAIFAMAHEARHIWQRPMVGEERADLGTVEYNMLEEELDANAFATAYMIMDHGVQPQFNGVDERIKEEIYKRAARMV